MFSSCSLLVKSDSFAVGCVQDLTRLSSRSEEGNGDGGARAAAAMHGRAMDVE